MAMGIVSDKDFDSEFGKLRPRERSESEESTSHGNPIPNATIVDNPTKGLITDLPTKGRGEGNVEVPNSLRNVIGQTAIEHGRHESVQLAKSFGISPSSASAYANGATSTANYQDGPNLSVIGQSKARIHKRARAKLLQALSHITEDKLQVAKARDLAGIAKDMSVVVKTMENETNTGETGKSGPTFVFYSPQFRKEEAYDVIDAKE